MKMNLNVLQFDMPARYYLKRPWKWFRELGINLRSCWQRITRGYSDVDVWNLDAWLLAVLPPMLLALANDECGAYPGTEPFDTLEKWQQWLCKMAMNLESLQEDWTETKNEYADEFFKHLEERRYVQETATGKMISYEPIDTELHDKYGVRMGELMQAQEDLTIETFKELGEHLYRLWS